MLENERFVLREEGPYVKVSFLREQPVEAGIRSYFVEDFKGRSRAVGGGLGVGGIVEVFVKEVVGAAGHGEGFHSEFFAGELVGVAEMNQGVANWYMRSVSTMQQRKERRTPSNDSIDQRLFSAEQILICNFLPIVIELQRQLVFKEIDIGPLVSLVS